MSWRQVWWLIVAFLSGIIVTIIIFPAIWRGSKKEPSSPISTSEKEGKEEPGETRKSQTCVPVTCRPVPLPKRTKTKEEGSKEIKDQFTIKNSHEITATGEAAKIAAQKWGEMQVKYGEAAVIDREALREGVGKVALQEKLKDKEKENEEIKARLKRIETEIEQLKQKQESLKQEKKRKTEEYEKAMRGRRSAETIQGQNFWTERANKHLKEIMNIEEELGFLETKIFELEEQKEQEEKLSKI